MLVPPTEGGEMRINAWAEELFISQFIKTRYDHLNTMSKRFKSSQINTRKI